MSKNACSNSKDKLSQAALLGILQGQSIRGVKIGEIVTYTKDNGRTDAYRVMSVGTTTAVIENVNETITADISKLRTGDTIPTIFDKLTLSQWTIVSFDAKTRVVCVQINSGVQLEMISLTLPVF